MAPLTESSAVRRSVFALLIVLALGSAAGRIFSTQLLFEPAIHRGANAGPEDIRRAWPAQRPEPMPTFSSNDRSRWAAIRALVDEGTYVIGRRDFQTVVCSAPAALAATDPLSLAVLMEAGYQARVRSDRGIIHEDGWDTVDKVLHPQRLEFYSTKPPLLTILGAGEYWVLKKLFGWSLKEQPWLVVRTILFTFNALPFVLYLWLLARLLDRIGVSDWASFFLVGAAAFGTLVTPFLITFNNHTLATFTVLIALYTALRIWDGENQLWLFAISGFFTGFLVTNELPAAAFGAALFALLAWRQPWRTFSIFTPLALLPIAALLLSNYLLLGQWKPAYSELGGPWYEYEGSHWRNVALGASHSIDTAAQHETKMVYATHLLVGHHGVFSLTPVFALTVVGFALALFSRPSRTGAADTEATSQQGKAPVRDGRLNAHPLPLVFYLLILAVSLVVVGYYILVAPARNYGGFSNGPRWLMWLTPLWLLSAVAPVEWLGRRRWGRAVALALLCLSVMSASYAPWNPWRHPWVYNFLDDRGLIHY